MQDKTHVNLPSLSQEYSLSDEQVATYQKNGHIPVIF